MKKIKSIIKKFFDPLFDNKDACAKTFIRYPASGGLR